MPLLLSAARAFVFGNHTGGKQVSANFENKKEVVAKITEQIKASKSVIVVHYTSMSVLDDNAVRAEMRKNDVEYKVYKNTLVRKAFNELGITDLDNDFNGPTAFAFGKDETSAARVCAQAAGKYTDKVVVKSGYIDGKYADAKTVNLFATIPSKEELYSKLAGSLQQIITRLAIAVKAVADKQA